MFFLKNSYLFFNLILFFIYFPSVGFSQNLISEEKVVTVVPKQLLTPIIIENLFAASIKKKNILYLIKRRLGLPFDTRWRFSQDHTSAKNHGDYTVFQRRFHISLKSIEFIDIVFRDDVTKNYLEKLRCNFQITHTETAKNLKLVEHYKLAHGYKFFESANQILNIKGKKTVRFNIGGFVRNAYKANKVVFLKEMIIFLPGLADNVMFKRPIESINFYKNNQVPYPMVESSLDVSATRLIEKDIENIVPAPSLNNLTVGREDPLEPISQATQTGMWWKLLFVSIAIIILVLASYTNKMKRSSRQLFCILLIVFRLFKVEKYSHLYLLVATLVYFLGLLPALRIYQSYLYTIGSIIFSLASYNFAKINYYKIANLLPWPLGEVSNQRETLLTSLFLFFLSIATVFKIVDLDRVAEQFASVGFIMLFTAVFCRVFKPFKEIDGPTVSKNDKDLANKISNA